jgi:hypothetical protein
MTDIDKNIDSWQDTQNSKYLDLIGYRIANESLTWIDQFLDYVNLFTLKINCIDIKDVGCQAFQVYKQLTDRKIKLNYFGYEIEQKYVDIGLSFFPELIENIFVHDFMTSSDILKTDISVCSATIEHINNWKSFLKILLLSTNKYAYIRTFLADEEIKSTCKTENSLSSYIIWQFSFNEFINEIKKYGFRVEIIIDKYTNSLPKKLNVYPPETFRSFYILSCEKI